MASLFKRKDSPYWYIAYYDKRLKRAGSPKSTGTTNRRKAEMFLSDFVKQLERELTDVRNKNKPLTISAAFIYFKENKPELSPSSLELYELAYTNLIKGVGDILITDFGHQDYLKLKSYLYNTKLSDQSKNTYLRHIKAFFNFFVKIDITNKNYIEMIKVQKKPVKTIPTNDLNIILDKSSYELRFLLRFLLLTGLRIGEALALKSSNINFDNNVMLYRNFKAKKDDVKPLLKEVKDLLIEYDYLKRDKQLFPFRSYEAAKWQWDSLMKTLKMKYNIHMLRKTCSTYLANIGVDIFFVQHYLGHSSVEITLGSYTHTKLEEMRKDIDAKMKAEKRKNAKMKTKHSVINSVEVKKDANID